MAASSEEKRSVLFICLGNICRSPIAEAVCLHLLEERGETDKWIVDSAALGTWHTGKGPDNRALATLRKNGLNNYKHKARTLTTEDFNKFDVIFGMDEENMEELEARKPKVKCRAKLELLGSYDPQNTRIIVDPYFESGTDAFDTVYEQCVRSLKAFIQKPRS